MGLKGLKTAFSVLAGNGVNIKKEVIEFDPNDLSDRPPPKIGLDKGIPLGMGYIMGAKTPEEDKMAREVAKEGAGEAGKAMARRR